DDPALLEKRKRDGKEAQLLCQTAGNEASDAIGGHLVGTWNVVSIFGALGEFRHRKNGRNHGANLGQLIYCGNKIDVEDPPTSQCPNEVVEGVLVLAAELQFFRPMKLGGGLVVVGGRCPTYESDGGIALFDPRFA